MHLLAQRYCLWRRLVFDAGVVAAVKNQWLAVSQLEVNHVANNDVVITTVMDIVRTAFEVGERVTEKRHFLRRVPIANVLEQAVLRFRKMCGQRLLLIA